MRLRIIAVGTRMPAWVTQGCSEYSKRLPRELPLEWVEIALAQRSRGCSIPKVVGLESQAILARVRRDSRLVALDLGGRPWSTPQLAGRLESWQMDGRDVDFMIGGPDGLGDDCLRRADESWSLSALTLPHPLVRVLLVEQIYRAWSLNKGLPYHR